jgi:hypothetical protein
MRLAGIPRNRPKLHGAAKQRLLLLGTLVLALLAASISAVAWLSGHGNITGVNYARIRIGMPLRDVIAILGAPSTDVPPLTYEDIHADESSLQKLGTPVYPDFFWDNAYWHDGSHLIFITTDGAGRVIAKSYSRAPTTGRLRRLVDWLGL